MKDKCLVSFASYGREDYNKAQLRMIQSTLGKWDGDYLIRSLDGKERQWSRIDIRLGTFPPPYDRTHKKVPYAFKVDIIAEAARDGYTKIVWCDSTILMNQNIDYIMRYANQHGVAAFHNLGHPLKNYISDVATQKLDIVGALNEIQQIMACVIIFDLSTYTGRQIFFEWKEISYDGVSFQNNGSIRPDFKAHRHDQAILSALLWKYNVPLLPYGNLIYYPNTGYDEKQIYFINKGVDV